MSAQHTGLFISFEGIDGAGKSTHIASVVKAFTQAGRQVVTTREPGGTALAETLRGLILNEPMDALTEALLIFAARRDHITRVIAPALQRGDVVISDRFTDATFAYQGAGRGFDHAVLETLERMVQTQETKGGALLQPDLTLWFDLDPAVAAQRLASARVPDKFESQPQTFFAQVAQGYAQRAAEQPQRFVRIDATPAPELVGEQVLRAVQSHLKAL
jgi:dTMP kinase